MQTLTSAQKRLVAKIRKMPSINIESVSEEFNSKELTLVRKTPWKDFKLGIDQNRIQQVTSVCTTVLNIKSKKKNNSMREKLVLKELPQAEDLGNTSLLDQNTKYA